MTITTDFEQLHEEKTVAELAIKIRADMEYTLRVLEEQITLIDESIVDVNFSSIPVGIRTEGANISAPPPGMASRPASLSATSTSSRPRPFILIM